MRSFSGFAPESRGDDLSSKFIVNYLGDLLVFLIDFSAQGMFCMYKCKEY